MPKINDNKIDSKSKNIAYHSCANRAVEIVLSYRREEDEHIELDQVFNVTRELYFDWVEFYNTSEARSELKKCPQCTGPLKVVPAGVSKKNGNRYDAFYACDACGYKKSVVEKKVDNETNLPAEERKVETPMPPKQ